MISQARKYIIKDRPLKDIATNANYLLRRVDDFKIIFKEIFEQGLPNFLDEEGLFLSEDEYQEKILEKRNDLLGLNQLILGVKGQDISDILQKDFNLLFMMRRTVNGFPSITYSFYFELDAINKEMLVVYFPATPTWKMILMFDRKWTNQKNYSSSFVPVSQVPRP